MTPFGFGLGLGFARRGSEGGSSFDPSMLPNLNLWLHVADLTDGLVSSWADKSGNGHTFAQASSPAQPTKSSAPNRVTYTAVPDKLINSDTTFVGTGAVTVGILFKLTATPGSGSFQVQFDLDNAIAGSPCEVALMNIGGYQNISFKTYGGTAVGINPTLDTSAHTLIFTFDGTTPSSASAYTCYLDGVSQTVNASSSFGNPGGGSQLGARIGDSNPFAGALGDLVVCGSVLSGANITALAAYLAAA